MSTISLTDRNEEIIQNIPRKYRALILNNILAKSIESGLFLKESAYVLDSETLNNIKGKLNLTEKKIQKSASQIIKERVKDKDEDEDEDEDDIFVGFD